MSAAIRYGVCVACRIRWWWSLGTRARRLKDVHCNECGMRLYRNDRKYRSLVERHLTRRLS